MPKVSVIIPTCNRPDLLPRAIKSILNQTYQDFEIIIVDDGREKSAESVVVGMDEKRLKYIKQTDKKGGAAARNTGIKDAQGDFIAFLDDDDEWLPEKLEIQMREFGKTSDDVGFCFSAVKNVYDDKQEDTEVMEGINDYYKISLARFKGFLTSSLIIKKEVFKICGMFDEELVSSQEAELIIRISGKFKGLGFNKPLVRMAMISGHRHLNSDIQRRIAGRELVIKKHLEEFKKYPDILAKHYFWLGLFYREAGQIEKARKNYLKAWQVDFKLRYFIHYMVNILLNFKSVVIFLLEHEPFKPMHMGPWIRFFYFRYYLKSKIDFKKIKKIFDAGCGKGYYADYLAGFLQSSEIIGWDINRQKEWGTYQRTNLFFKQADLNDLNEKGQYHLIISVDSLEHIPNNIVIIRKIYQALAPDGYFYLHVPCGSEEKFIFPRKFFKEIDEWAEEEHIGEQHTLNKWKEILCSLGFKIILSRYSFTFWGHLSWELETILRLRKDKIGNIVNIVLMPFYKFLGLLDLFLPIGKGDNLIIVKK